VPRYKRKIENSLTNHVVVKDMGRRKRPGISPLPAETDIPATSPGEVNIGKCGNPTVVFSNFLEFGIVFFCIAYSLFCIDAYVLNAVHLKLSIINLSILLGGEFLVLGSALCKKIQLVTTIKTNVYGILVFLISFLISLKISPTLLPNNWSADYPNHYILVDFLSTHEQLPLLSSGLGEMVQYPFGPSLFTSVTAKIIPLSLMTMMGFLAAVISALVAVTVYLLGRKLLERYTDEKNMTDAVALVSAFMVFSVPVYFLDQYCGNFYYSMIFGELLVLLAILALMNVETGNRSWIYIFIIATMGIIFTYTLYIIIPVVALVLFAFLNPDKIRALMDRVTVVSCLLVTLLFLLFTYERLAIGSGILQHEGLTVEFDIMNFNILFIILVICGIIIGVKYVPGYLRSALFAYSVVMTAEYLLFVFLDQFGIIAVYYANKIFYLLVLVLSISACLPVLFAIRHIQKDNLRTVAAVGIIGLIGIFSVFIALTYPLNTKPVVTTEDVIFAHKAETYLHENNIPYQNLSITTGELKGYWLGLLLHMDKNYAQQHFLSKATPFSDWLQDPNARYVAGEMVNASYPEFFEMNGVQLQIVVREGQKVLIRKVD
jgi:hypothetical protein